MDTELVEESEVRAEAEIAQESSSKRAGTELEQESIKKQKVDEYKETAELQRLIKVVLDKEEVAIDAIPLETKPPSIVDYKIHKEGKKTYYQIIRADGSSKMPEEGYERVIWGDLKTMFDPHVEDQLSMKKQEILKKNIKFRGGLLGLKDFLMILELLLLRSSFVFRQHHSIVEYAPQMFMRDTDIFIIATQSLIDKFCSIICANIPDSYIKANLYHFQEFYDELSNLIITKLNGTKKFIDEIGELRVVSSHMLGAFRVQTPQNNSDNLKSIREEDGTLETVDSPVWVGFDPLAPVDSITPIESNKSWLESFGLWELTYFRVLLQDVTGSANLPFLSLFFGVRATNFSLGHVRQGHVSLI
ncbi:hypothetical protein Tco_0296181 [Tanacetum coccineum]